VVVLTYFFRQFQQQANCGRRRRRGAELTRAPSLILSTHRPEKRSDLKALEERVKVNRQSRTNLSRILCAGFALLTAGCLVLASGSRSRQSVGNAQPQVSSFLSQNAAAQSPFALSNSAQKSSAEAKPSVMAAIAKLPLMFEPNVGQANFGGTSAVKFIARGNGYSLFLAPDGVVMHLRSGGSANSRVGAKPSTEFLGMKLVGANP